jgi:hypothetical protein
MATDSKDLNTLGKLLEFLAQLEARHIWYRLEHVRDSIMVITTIPGERWEVEFFEDGQVEVERFSSPGKIEHEIDFTRLFAE